MNELNKKDIELNSFDKFIRDDIHYLSLKFIGQSKTKICPHPYIIRRMQPYIKKEGISLINNKMFELLQSKIQNDYIIELNNNQNYYLQSMIDSYFKITLDDLQY